MDGKTPTIRIQIFEGDSLVREEVFTSTPIRIGKAGQAHLRLTDPAVSRQHAVIDYLENGEVRITDSQSTAGTYVQGRKVTQTALQPGNEIVVGSTRLVIDYVAEASAIKAPETFQSSVSQSDLKAGRFGVEVSLNWDDYPLQHGFFPVGSTVKVGEGTKDDFFVPEAKTGFESFVFLKPDDKFFLMNVAGDRIDADFLVDDKIIRLPEMKRRGLVIGDEWVRIDHRTAARVRYQDLVFVVGLSSQPRRVMGSSWKRFSMREHMYLLLSLMIHLALMLLIALVPEEQLKATRDPYDRETKALRKIQVAMLERKVEEEKKKEEEEIKKKFEEAKDNDGMVDRLSRVEPTEKQTSKIVVADTETDRNVANQALTQVMGEQDARFGRLLDMAGSGLGGGTMGIRVIGDNGIDADLASSLGAFGGTMGGGAGGFQGTGAWGGGGEYAPADIRGISGLSKKDAEGASSKIKFKKGDAQLQVFAGDMKVGALDKDMVRRYVQSKMNQIRWCYQQEAQKNPELAGNVDMTWVILPTGYTAGVKVRDTTMRNAAVERCIMERIATWRFPEPKGGAAVQVSSYPFIFRLTK